MSLGVLRSIWTDRFRRTITADVNSDELNLPEAELKSRLAKRVGLGVWMGMTVQHTGINRGIDMRFGSIHYLSSELVLSYDDELVQRVVAHLQNRLGSQVRNFQMSAREDGLILRGQVRSHYGKQMVQEVVMQISGHSILANDIEVLPIHLAGGDCSHRG